MTANAATTNATDEIVDLDRQYWEAVKAHDGVSVGKLTGDSCIVVGPQGVLQFKRAEVAEMASSSGNDHQINAYKFDDATTRVQRIGDNLALVAYEVESKFTEGGRESSKRAFDSSVWVREGGRWRCVMHTETPATN